MDAAMAMQLHSDVPVIYSPPRVAQMALEFGWARGWGVGLTTVGDPGNRSDSSIPAMIGKAFNVVDGDIFLFIIGSPVCTHFSAMMTSNWARLGSVEKKKRL